MKDDRGLFTFPKKCVAHSAGIQLIVLLTLAVNENTNVTKWFVAKLIFNLIMFSQNFAEVKAKEVSAGTD